MGDAAHNTLREHLALALDVSDLDVARRLAGTLRPYFSVAKVGLELFAAAGPSVVEGLLEDGYRVFVDLKLHDIPTTVRKAAFVLGGLGASYATVHTAGGEEMLLSAVEGLAAGAKDAGLASPMALGVTVLTSDPNADEATLATRAAMAARAGCGGVVCAAPDLAIVRSTAPGLFCVVPGTRLAGSAQNDQARVADPRVALEAGAGLLVIGRQVTDDPDPIAAAQALTEALS